MQELAHHTYIETGYAGVTLGAINWSHGLILIDAPFRAEDARLWRSALMNLGGGVDRLLVNLDTHFDRTLGVRAMECTVVGHEKMAEVFRNRPVTFKTQGAETGADWELYNGLGSIRWVPPDITFSDNMVIHWDESPLVLEHHPGPAAGAIWASLPSQRIVFVGDAVLPDQPPYLASANLPQWIEQLKLLLSPSYQDFLVVSGRGGLVAQQQIRRQMQYLEKTLQMLSSLAERKAPVTDTERLVDELMADYSALDERETQYRQRLKHGLHQYYVRHYQATGEELVD